MLYSSSRRTVCTILGCYFLEKNKILLFTFFLFFNDTDVLENFQYFVNFDFMHTSKKKPIIKL
jgi:hypothetical protein